MLIAPNPRRPGRSTGCDHDINIVEDRLHPRRQRRLSRAYFRDLALRDQTTEPRDCPRSRFETLRVGQFLDVLVYPAPHPRQYMAVHGPGRIVRVTPEHLMAEVAQQRLRPVQCPLLGPADAADHGGRQLGAQRDSQPTRLAGRRFDEPAARSLTGVGHVQEQCRVFDRARQRTVDTQPKPRIVVRGDRNPIPLRLEAEDPAPAGRDADRPRAVGAQRERSQTGSHCGGAPATAAAGGVGQIPRVVRGSEGHRFGEGPQHHLRHRSLTQDHRPGCPQRAHHLGVGGGR